MTTKTRLTSTGNHYISGIYDEISYLPRSLLFDGSSSYLQFTLASAIGTGDFTIDFWMMPLSFTNQTYEGIVETRTVANDSAGFSLLFQSPNLYYIKGGGTSSSVSIASSGLSLMNWSHVAIVRKSGVVNVYIGGVAKIVNFADTTNYTKTTVKIGDTFNSYYFVGHLTNLRILNRAVYTQNFTPQGPLPLNSNTVIQTQIIDYGYSQYLYDGNNSFPTLFPYIVSGTILDSSNNITITNSNVDIVNDTYPFNNTIQGGSIYFNGSSSNLQATLPTQGAPYSSPIGTSDFALDFWVLPFSFTNETYPGLFDIRTSGSDASGFAVYFQSTNLVIRVGGTSHTYSLATAGISLFHWNHIVVIRTAGKIYVGANGSNLFSIVDSSNFTRTKVYLGSTFDSYNLLGLMTDIRLIIGSTGPYTLYPDFTGFFYDMPSSPVSTYAGIASDTFLLLNSYNSSNVYVDSSNYSLSVSHSNTFFETLSPYPVNPIGFFRIEGDTGNFGVNNQFDEVTLAANNASVQQRLNSDGTHYILGKYDEVTGVA